MCRVCDILPSCLHTTIKRTNTLLTLILTLVQPYIDIISNFLRLSSRGEREMSRGNVQGGIYWMPACQRHAAGFPGCTATKDALLSA